MLLYLLGQIVTWRHKPNPLDYNWPCNVFNDWQSRNCSFKNVSENSFISITKCPYYTHNIAHLFARVYNVIPSQERCHSTSLLQWISSFCLFLFSRVINAYENTSGTIDYLQIIKIIFIELLNIQNKKTHNLYIFNTLHTILTIQSIIRQNNYELNFNNTLVES